MKKCLLVFALLLFTISFYCGAQPVITSFSPISGSIGATVTIYGSNFNPLPSDNIVFFGATAAPVLSSSPDSIKVSVPFGATYQPVSITDLSNNLTAYSSSPFVVTSSCGGGISLNSFAPKVNFLTGPHPSFGSAGDLDNDGKPDFVVVDNSTDTMSVFLNTSNSDTISFAPRIDFITGDNPYIVLLSDIDGDGKLDIGVVNNSSNTVSVFLNTSSVGVLSFAPKLDFVAGTGPRGLAIADLDLDGKPELIVTNTQANTVSVFLNTSSAGNISFAAKVDFPTGNGPHGIAIGDLDNDNKPDIALANYFSNTVSAFRNIGVSGVIAFASKVDFNTDTYPNSVSIADFNGDGKRDFAVSCNDGNPSVLNVLKNTSNVGSISFAPKLNYSTAGGGNYSVSVNDLDGDGMPDIAVLSANTNMGGKVSVFKNTSSTGISFSPKVDFLIGITPLSVSLADVNSDGKTDIISANGGDNTFAILKNFIGAPVMTIASTATICSGDTLIIPLSSSSSATYTWMSADNQNTVGESISAEVSDTLINSITNNSIVPEQVVYTVTPTAINGCGTGPLKIVSVTVNPLASMTIADSVSVCNGCYTNIPLISTTSATYTWIASDNSNITGESITLKTTATLRDTLTNTVPAEQAVFYTITPASACGTGSPKILKIKVAALDTTIVSPANTNEALIGIPSMGGSENNGTFIKTNIAGENLVVTDFFKRAIPGGITGKIQEDDNGVIYGIASPNILYKYEQTDGKASVVHTFNSGDSLGTILANIVYSNGLLYCKTSSGGTNNEGVFFSYNTTTEAFAILFNCSSTLFPVSAIQMIRHSNGKFYGLSNYNSFIRLFELDIVAETYTEINGYPNIGPMRLLAGNGAILYITWDNELISFNVNTQALTTLVTVGGTYGNGIDAVCLGNNKFYFITISSPSKLIECDLATNVLTIKHTFSQNGSSPVSALICSPSGKLYASNSHGEFYTYDTYTSAFTTDTMDYPQRAILHYHYSSSTNRMIGLGNFGPFMFLDTINNKWNNLFFIGKNNGERCASGFVAGPDGKYYATCFAGGGYDNGAIIEYDPSNDSLISHTVTGAVPDGDLVYASAGDFYYCNNSLGGISKYNCYTNTFDTAIIWSGYAPHSPPSYHSNGKLYGVTPHGGNGGYGTVYEYDPVLDTINIIHELDGYDGRQPDSELTMAPDGYYYGVAPDGGGGFFTNNFGVIFKFNPTAPGSYGVVKDFNSSTVFRDPYGKLLSDSNSLYGVCNNKLFRFDITNTNIIVLHDFLLDTTKGYDPTGYMILSSNGNIYGVAKGGSFHKGVLFEYNLHTNIYTKKQDFDGVNGAFNTIPQGWHLSQIACPAVTLPVLNITGIVNKCIGSSLLLNAVNTIENAVGFYWYKDSSLVSVNSMNLLVNNLTIADSGNYVLKITNACGVAIFSDTVKVRFNCDVWPGDTDDNNRTDNNDLLPIGIHYSQTGMPRSVVSNAWESQSAFDWGSNQLNGRELKHVDCNGDGAINADDTLAININFSLVHAFVENNISSQRQTTVPLYFNFSGTTYSPGDWVDAEIWVGDSNAPVNELYGIAFNIHYDVSLVEPGTEQIIYPSQGWLGTMGTNALKISKIDPLISTAYGAVTRTDHFNKTGYGKVADFRFQIKNNLITSDTITLAFSGYKAVDSIGIEKTFDSQSGMIIINPVVSGIIQEDALSGIEIYPNPYSASTTISYNLNKQSVVRIEVYNATGQKVETLVNATQPSGYYKYSYGIQQKNRGSGIYFLRITIDDKSIVKRMISID